MSSNLDLDQYSDLFNLSAGSELLSYPPLSDNDLPSTFDFGQNAAQDSESMSLQEFEQGQRFAEIEAKLDRVMELQRRAATATQSSVQGSSTPASHLEACRSCLSFRDDLLTRVTTMEWEMVGLARAWAKEDVEKAQERTKLSDWGRSVDCTLNDLLSGRATPASSATPGVRTSPAPSDSSSYFSIPSV